MIGRLILALGGVVVGCYAVREVFAALARTWAAHPILVSAAGVVAVFVLLAAVAVMLDRADGARRIEIRRASAEFGPRPDEQADADLGCDTGEHVGHVVHHVVHHLQVEVTHVHRHEGGEATVRREPLRTYLLDRPPDGAVVEGELVRRVIEGGAA